MDVGSLPAHFLLEDDLRRQGQLDAPGHHVAHVEQGPGSLPRQARQQLLVTGQAQRAGPPDVVHAELHAVVAVQPELVEHAVGCVARVGADGGHRGRGLLASRGGLVTEVEAPTHGEQVEHKQRRGQPEEGDGRALTGGPPAQQPPAQRGGDGDKDGRSQQPVEAAGRSPALGDQAEEEGGRGEGQSRRQSQATAHVSPAPIVGGAAHEGPQTIPGQQAHREGHQQRQTLLPAEEPPARRDEVEETVQVGLIAEGEQQRHQGGGEPEAHRPLRREHQRRARQ